MARPAAVVRQPRDGPDAQLPQAAEPLVRPRPVDVLEAVGRQALPQHGIADGADAQAREEVEITHARGVVVALHLIEEHVAYPVDGALEAPRARASGSLCRWDVRTWTAFSTRSIQGGRMSSRRLTQVCLPSGHDGLTSSFGLLPGGRCSRTPWSPGAVRRSPPGVSLLGLQDSVAVTCPKLVQGSMSRSARDAWLPGVVDRRGGERPPRS